MKIIDKLKTGAPAFSFEFFPPKNEEGMNTLFETVARLKQYDPAYVSVTYGAGGSTRKLTVELVRRIKAETGIDTMAHLTCVGADQAELRSVLDQLQEAGIDNLLPLRGDPPKGETTFAQHEGGFGYASELIEFIRKDYEFCLGGACYPEKHPEAESMGADLANLKCKVDAGLDFLVTQLFFNNDDYFEFVRCARELGIEKKIVAGIMPVTNYNQIKRFTKMCGAALPERLRARLEEADGDSERIRAIGVAHATEQCRDLLSRGAPGIHFYTLNRSPATVQILEALRS